MPKQTPNTPDEAAADSRNEYTVDELARVSDTTVRNVRAYQDRGLLAPPEKRGRVGIYDDTHVARLKLINHLLARGYTLSNIQDLIMAIDEGHDLRSILGLETAIGGRWSHERPKTYSLAALAQMFGPQTASQLSRVTEFGLLERHGLSFVAKSPALLEAAAAMTKEGIPPRELLDVISVARPHFDAIARLLVDLVVKRLDRYDEGTLPPVTDVPALVDAIWRLRPLAAVFVEAETNRALENAASAYLGGRVATILDKKLSDEAARQASASAPSEHAGRSPRKGNGDKA
ncbi:MerR family transcriptional regulator [Burkholderia vietnamiensis]|jgi:DNA-binding transcriptional MerR regulator|uniref:Transcriptional regulator, MerR family n=2 Tax=Burkholderia vietnamiensis TaxID=60552 RepID=A4JPE4_BURVG|nr:MULTISPECIES: MerR family transcriptional regulator [Burkholderia]ABO58147.1 transcriptional regulator, MerR family [Burkholderia vietnamiensis G4]AJY04644.1 merR HTH regulatory family protein [Burkholderia vietnamiensis LMG 10929]AOJ98832.1 MerR family transcriptional regulator [Burkholderia vietnamiensis]AOK43669.1 MerR family transcriptional regulator [Burkholderia vietnamiensis]AVR12596.1 MerR family transcriptional regulator [Burkholderia vietnamiensis]